MILAGKLARIGNRILGALAAILVLILLLYGGYSIWDTWHLYHSALSTSELLRYKPKATAGGGEDPSLAELAAINSEVIGWITIDGTNIDYPLVQSEDILKYVNTDVYGNFSLAGAIFLDPRNANDFTDSYSLVYGHHMDNGAMFGDVTEFENEDYFNAHETGTLYLTDGTVRPITLFACIETDASDPVIFNPTSHENGNIEPLLNHIREKKVQERDIGLTADQGVIALSTCEDAETNGRTILFGRFEEAQ